MSKLYLGKYITNDNVGLKYLKELMLYSLPLKNKLREITLKLNGKTTYKKLKVIESEFNGLVFDFRKLKESYNSINKYHEIYLYDMLYLNGIYTFLNCYINNGSIENDFNQDILKSKLNIVEVLQTLANRYKYSIYNSKEITNESYNDSLKIPKYVVNNYVLFIRLQKNISTFNEKELFPLFARISDNLSIKYYAPETYKKIKSKIKRFLNKNVKILSLSDGLW